MAGDEGKRVSFESGMLSALSEMLSGEGIMVNGFVVMAEGITKDGQYAWIFGKMEGQPLTRTMGQIEWLRGIVEFNQRHMLGSG